MKKILIVYAGLVIVLLASVVSCSKYYDPPPVFENAVDKAFTKKRKVLLIVIDGAAGPEVKKIAPPALMGLTEHAKFSWEAFGDAWSGDGPSWINILTGKSAAVSAISDSTLAPVENEEEGHEHEELPVYSNFFQRLLVSGYLPQTVAVTSWNTLAERGLTYAGSTITAGNDEAVKDSAVLALANGKVGVMLVNFNGVNLAGRAAAFSADQPTYKDAVLKVDGYVKEIMDALKKRPDYANEDWLTIVTSNHGGDGNSYGGASLTERKIFTIYNNAAFVKKEFTVGELVNANRHSGGSSSSTRNITDAILPAADAAAYEVGASGEFTIMAKVRRTAAGSGNGTVFSKVSHPYSSVRGWELMIEGSSRFRFIMGNGTGGNTPVVFAYGPVGLAPAGTWQVVALRIFNDTINGVPKRFALTYVDGKIDSVNGKRDITGFNLTSNNNDLIIGNINPATGNTPVMVSQLGFWNKALPESYILNYGCQMDMPATDPYYSNLRGYWPLNEGIGKTYYNQAPSAAGKDMVMNFAPAWNLVPALSCKAARPSDFFVSNMDIAPNLFYWLNLTPLTAWGFESKEWLSTYETEFIK